MEQGTPIATDVPHVEHLADFAARDQLVGFAMRGHPLERPVDHEALILAHAFDHGIGFL